jgi:carboxyl-terminal processing protease
VARKIWGNDGFYLVFNDTNEVFQQAIKLFDHIPELSRKSMYSGYNTLTPAG